MGRVAVLLLAATGLLLVQPETIVFTRLGPSQTRLFLPAGLFAGASLGLRNDTRKPLMPERRRLPDSTDRINGRSVHRWDDYGVEVPRKVTPENAAKPRIITYQSPATGLLSVQVSLLPVRNGRQVKVLVVGFAPDRT
jgi:hypothetical protein